MRKKQLLDIEKGFWHKGADYYNQHITEDAVFVFPGMRLGKEDGVAAADAAPRWDSLDITATELVELSKEIAILTYHATGQREGEEPYIGNVTTIYRLVSGGPKMAFHQHTPDPEESEEKQSWTNQPSHPGSNQSSTVGVPSSSTLSGLNSGGWFLMLN